MQLKFYLRFNAFDVSTSSGRDSERHRKIFLTSLSSLLAKTLSIVALLVTAPLTLHYLGLEQFGLLMTISAFVTITGFIDIGIGNGLLNIVAEASGRNNKFAIKEAVSSASIMLFFIGFLGLIFFLGIAELLNWGHLYNIQEASSIEEAKRATLVLVACIAVGLPTSIAQKVQLGYQEGFQVYLWQSLGSVLMFLGVLACIYFGAKLQWFVLAVAGGPTASLLLNWLHQFGMSRRWLFPALSAFNWRLSRKILITGLFFTLFQIAAFVGTGLDNLVISHVIGPSEVPKYALMYKLLTGLLITQIFTSALWPAYSEALERGDVHWAQKTFLRSMKMFSILGLLTALLMGFGSKWTLSIWVGDDMIPTLLMATGFACWSFITNFFAGVSAVLSNNKSIKKLTFLTTFAALFSLSLKIIFARYYGVDLVIWGTVIGYGIICIPGLIISRKLLNHV